MDSEKSPEPVRSEEAPATIPLASATSRPEEMGDARLVELARSGADSAFAVLVARYERKLIRVLCRLVHDEELARDLAQETFWKVYNRLDRFDTARRFGPWLFRVGVNLALDGLRRREGPPTSSIDRPGRTAARAMELPDPDPRIREEIVQEVRFVLDKVPLPYRTILILRDVEGFSSAEVAAIVGRREATIRWRLAKARDLFRQQWERRHGEGSGPLGASEAQDQMDLPPDPEPREEARHVG